MKKIYIPHLNYTVRVHTFKFPPPEIPNALAYVQEKDSNSCDLYVSSHKENAGDLAHELVHVLQFICIQRNIDFARETEHMGYLMHWLMGEVLGYEWK